MSQLLDQYNIGRCDFDATTAHHPPRLPELLVSPLPLAADHIVIALQVVTRDNTCGLVRVDAGVSLCGWLIPCLTTDRELPLHALS